MGDKNLGLADDGVDSYNITVDPINERDDNEELTILEEMRERSDYAQTVWADNYNRSNIDRKMLAGYQWPESIRVERELDGRPVLTINKLPSFVAQVSGEMRQNKISVSLKPVERDVKGDETKLQNIAGSADYSRTEILEGIIRNIEYISNAEAHQDRQFKNLLGGAFAWFRVLTERNPFDPFVLDLKIAGIKNPTSAVIDPDCKEPDYSDARFGFVYDKMKRKEFMKRYPDATIGSLSQQGNNWDSWWLTDDEICIAEYFERVACTKTIYKMSNGEIWSSDDLKSHKDKFEQLGGTDELEIVDQIDIQDYKVIWRKVTAFSVLEGPKEFPSATIPLIPVLGREVITEDETIYESLIRHSLDSQQEYNYWRTAATEMVALAPKAPFVGPAECFENHKEEWKNSNRKNLAYLPYTEVPSGNSPRREPAHQSPIGEISQSMQANDDMKATMGLFDASLGARSNETSGVAIAERKKEGNTGTYEFTDNFMMAYKRVCKVLIEAIPRVYDTERTMRIFSKENNEDWVRINTEVEIDGEVLYMSDLGQMRYDVQVDVGPAFSTQREEAVVSLMAFIERVPAAGNLAMDLIAQNMDWPGADELAKRLKKAVPPEFLDAKDRDDDEPPPPPTPETQAQLAIAEAQSKTEQAKVAQKELDLQIQQQKTAEKAIQAQLKPEEIRDIVAQSLADIFQTATPPSIDPRAPIE